MGCVHGKCCCGQYPTSSDGENREELGPYTGQGKHILANRSLDCVAVPSHNFRLEYSVLTQRGHYPDTPEKENQDSFCIKTKIQNNPNVHFFGVFDGHGQFGTQCSNFVKNRLVEILSSDPTLLDDPLKAYHLAFLATNEELHNSEIDDTMSGTTAITVLVIGDTLYVANVGDSRAVIAVKEGNRIVAEDLSHDQTPFRKDECERVKLCGARVLSVDQVEGLKDPGIQSWGDEETEGSDPPRLWVQNGMYPGTAFTRSVGDSTAEKIGVVAVPEVSMVQLTPNHPFFVVASDGVFEFLSSQTVVEMVARYSDPRDACSAIASESYNLWLEHEHRTDDITIILIQIKGLSNSGANSIKVRSGVNIQPNALKIRKGTPDTFVYPAAGSEVLGSLRSDFSDLHPCQHNVSPDQSPGRVVPSPALPLPSVVKFGVTDNCASDVKWLQFYSIAGRKRSRFQD
ncbi:hypothetical protein RHSIM_Rhsim04G0213000 [Rhododendron simsii]|uniref:protein-serine/threonine phosphatase n=1 Tax=Rhododendron simsii TaxID=118357 RepID=A0A834H0P2_RHOSS|nr:hypothetical protein RHSIM_Rhsim04G0213000 [Rhododendron simsii]